MQGMGPEPLSSSGAFCLGVRVQVIPARELANARSGKTRRAALSGYDTFGEAGGNVLLVFTADEQ